MFAILAMSWLGRRLMSCEAPGSRITAVSIPRSFSAWNIWYDSESGVRRSSSPVMIIVGVVTFPTREIGENSQYASGFSHGSPS